MPTFTDALFSELPGHAGHLGIITLNRQNALNALSQSMIDELDRQLAIWATNDKIKAVVIRAAEGRAFCAGGDIRSIYQKKLVNDPLLVDFFRDEYRLNQRIFHFPKPYIALLDGITMGGGAGISIHGSHRVATERLVFAMPETAIGFHPDVGASYFLSRLPANIGLYLGLSGERINYRDCYALGLIDYVIAPENQDNLIHALAEASFLDKITTDKILAQFAVFVPNSDLLLHQKIITDCFAKSSVEEIIQALHVVNNAWCQATIKGLLAKSPSSLKITYSEINHAKTLDFDQCMQMEFRVTSHMVENPDFFEGIRAVMVDKDHHPHWQPATLLEVSKEQVAYYFSSLD